MIYVFRPGNKAPHSGVYKVTHAQHHAEPHDVTLLFGDTFPVCLTCSKQVQFEVAISAAHRECASAFSAGYLKMRQAQFREWLLALLNSDPFAKFKSLVARYLPSGLRHGS